MNIFSKRLFAYGIHPVCPLALFASLVFAMTVRAESTNPSEFMYVGTWNNIAANETLGFAKGVYAWRLDSESGTTTPIGLVAKTVASADVLAASPNGRYLYVSQYNGCLCTRSWPFPGAPPAGVIAYRIERSGELTLLNEVSALGDMPAEIRVDATGRTLAIANYYGGNVVTYSIWPDGHLGNAVSDFHHEGESVHASAGPHPHGLAFSADNQWLFVADQGIDRLYVYAFDPATSELTPADPPYYQFEPGTGPRNVGVHPNNKWIYVNTEQGGNVHFFTRQNGAGLEKVQTVSIVPPGASILMGAAQVHVTPDGRHLYANHRPNENVAVFSIDGKSGMLERLQFSDSSKRVNEGGANPALTWEAKSLWQKVETGARSFDLNSNAAWLASANLGENAIVLLKRNADTGKLEITGNEVAVPQPSFVLFVSPK